MNRTEKKQDWRVFFRFLKRAKPPWGWYLLSLVVSMIISTIGAKMPQVAGEIMNGNFDKKLVATYSAVQMVSLLFSLGISIFGAWIGYNMTRVLQHNIWKRFLRLPMKELDRIPASSLPSRITSDISEVSYGISYVIQLIAFTYQLILMMKIVAGMNGNLALMMLAVIPYTLLVAFITGRLQFKVNDRKQSAYARFMSYVTEGLNNLRLIKSSSTETYEQKREDKEAGINYQAEIYGAKVLLVTSPLNYSVGAVAQAVILAYGGVLVSRGELEIGNLITIFMYLESINLMVLQYVFAWSEIKKVQGATAKVSEIMDIESETMEREVSFTVPDQDIRFENVTFSYGGKDVLKNASFTIPKGKTTALVGPSGSGKSTILNLLERFYEPKSGRILFGNEPVERYHLDEWREAFGYVPQCSPLLSGTIRENICYGLDKTPSEEQLIKAAKIANIYDFIQMLPQGFDTPIGQIGGHLSGGERQRIAIARTAILDPEFLLLDEATSNLDPQNASAVQKALTNLMEGRTSIIVAHNLCTVAAADHIVVVNGGTIEAEGTHDELCGKNELYHHYCDLHLKNRCQEA